MTGTTTLAVSSGIALVDDGRALWVVDRGTGWMATAVFVSALVTGIGLLGGVAILITVGLAGLAPLLLGVFGAAVLVMFIQMKRRREQAPPEALTVLCVVDLAHGQLKDAHGRPLAWLNQVQLKRAFQIGSSSPALEAHYPGGKLILVRGNPFAGSIDDVEHVLRQRLPSP